MTDAVLRLEDLRKSFGAVTATDGVSIDIRPGEIHALIGPNGAGKTTLVNQIGGELQPTSGRIFFKGLDVTGLGAPERVRLGIGRTFQTTSVFQELTVLENIMLPIQIGLGRSFRFFAPSNSDQEVVAAANKVLTQVGLAHRAHDLTSNLPHGEQKQLDLAVALGTQAQLLLLDEPLAGMSVEDSRSMIDLLHGLRGHFSMLLIEHDMTAVFGLADRISVLFYGRIIATGSAEEIRLNSEVREAYLGHENEAEEAHA